MGAPPDDQQPVGDPLLRLPTRPATAARCKAGPTGATDFQRSARSVEREDAGEEFFAIALAGQSWSTRARSSSRQRQRACPVGVATAAARTAGAPWALLPPSGPRCWRDVEGVPTAAPTQGQARRSRFRGASAASAARPYARCNRCARGLRGRPRFATKIDARAAAGVLVGPAGRARALFGRMKPRPTTSPRPRGQPRLFV